MGEFQGGRWMIVLAIYYVLEFTIIYLMLNASAVVGVPLDNVYAPDTGFTNLQRYGATCSGNPVYLCSALNIESTDSTLCNSYAGCNFVNVSTFEELFTGYPFKCEGVFQPSCDTFTDSRECSFVGCDWINATKADLDDSASIATIGNTFGFMFTFTPSYGNPTALNYLVAFFFTVLPSLMFLIALYFSLPIVH